MTTHFPLKKQYVLTLIKVVDNVLDSKLQALSTACHSVLTITARHCRSLHFIDEILECQKLRDLLKHRASSAEAGFEPQCLHPIVSPPSPCPSQHWVAISNVAPIPLILFLKCILSAFEDIDSRSCFYIVSTKQREMAIFHCKKNKLNTSQIPVKAHSHILFEKSKENGENKLDS